MTPAELADIQRRAALAQTATAGRWPATPDAVRRLLRYSTASSEFVATARRDVLLLCAELRTAWEETSAAKDECERLRRLAAAYDIGDDDA